MPDENETAVNETVNAGLETEELPPSKKRGIGIAAWIAIVWLVVVGLRPSSPTGFRSRRLMIASRKSLKAVRRSVTGSAATATAKTFCR